MDYDGTQIDPAWHPWIHYVSSSSYGDQSAPVEFLLLKSFLSFQMTDEPPSVKKPTTYSWVIKPDENKTGEEPTAQHRIHTTCCSSVSARFSFQVHGTPTCRTRLLSPRSKRGTPAPIRRRNRNLSFSLLYFLTYLQKMFGDPWSSQFERLSISFK